MYYESEVLMQYVNAGYLVGKHSEELSHEISKGTGILVQSW